jgi:4-diphosphocytidyl-2-C-methyl-D-erythritol kinase
VNGGYVRFPAPGKLNLFLHVVGRRADGYHLLQTVFRLIERADEVRLRVRDDGRICRVNDIPGIEPDADLCVRAARALQTHTRCRLGVDILLEKRLPVGGGVGGGSSDAASTLIGLNRLWHLGLTQSELLALAARLGADVPVFVFGRNAFAEGVGERLQAIELPSAWYLVLAPQVAVSTAEIFSAPELTRNTNAIKMATFSVGQGRNDLEPVVCRRYPEVARHLAWLRQFGQAAMTGSGACVFSAFDSESEARRLQQQLPEGMRGFVTRGLDRHPLCADERG